MKRIAPLLIAVFLVGGSVSLHAAPTKQARAPRAGLAVAIFAGGCFWCMEPPFDKTPGVLSTTSGYTGGRTRNASYEQVTAGGTGHYEALRVVYDPKKVSYAKLLDIFWRNVDPLDPDGQFCDKGDSYRTAIFVRDANERRAAEASRAAVQKRFKQPVVTPVIASSEFWEAEDYHQDYYKKNPVRYKFYRFNCGRDQRLEQLWGK